MVSGRGACSATFNGALEAPVTVTQMCLFAPLECDHPTHVERIWTIARSATLRKREPGGQERKAVRDALLAGWAAGEKAPALLAEKHGVSRRDVYRWVHRHRKKLAEAGGDGGT